MVDIGFIGRIYRPRRIFGATSHSIIFWGSDIGELRFIWKFLQSGMTFIDIGAYHGLYTVVAAQRLKSGRVIAFEPSPRERRRLLLHLRMNHCRNVEVEHWALSATKGQTHMYLVVQGFTSMNSLRHPPIPNRCVTIEVPTITLDEYCLLKGIQQIDLIKVDVEGAEMEVFQGAQQVLQPYTSHPVRPLLICEVLDWVTEPWGYRAVEIIKYLQRLGYYWFDFHEDGSLSPHIMQERYHEIKNYLAVPEEKLALVEDFIHE